MDDVQSLRKQVKKLQRRLDQIEGTPAAREQQQVSELIGDGAGSASKFSEAVAYMTAETNDKLRVEAEAELARGLVTTPGNVHSWRQDYARLGGNVLDSLLVKHGL